MKMTPAAPKAGGLMANLKTDVVILQEVLQEVLWNVNVPKSHHKELFDASDHTTTVFLL